MLFKHAPELADLGHPGGIVLGHHMKVEEILLHISMLAVEVIRSLRGSMIPKRGVNDVFFLKSMFGQRMLAVHEQHRASGGLLRSGFFKLVERRQGHFMISRESIAPRPEERRVGKEWVRTCRSRW